MTRRLGRTGMAALLVAVGVIVPCTAWFVVGSRAASEQAARLERGPAERARQEAARLAGQVSLRLEEWCFPPQPFLQQLAFLKIFGLFQHLLS